MKLWEVLKQLVITSRPVGWIVFSGIFVSSLNYAGVQFGADKIIHLLLLTFPAGIICNGLNDVADYPYDLKNPRKKSGWSGNVLDKKYHKIVIWLAIIFSGLLLIPPLYYQNWLMFWATVTTIFISYSYSFKPFRFKSVLGVEILSNLVGTLALILIGFSYGGNLLDFINKASTNLITFCGVIIAIAFQAFISDYEVDKASGDHNLIHFLGKKLSSVSASLIYLVCFFTTTYPSLKIGFVLCFVLCLLPLFFFKAKFFTLFYYSNVIILTISFLSIVIF
jgi:4-hydroxybenzoate polyprenyltransferase